MSAVETTQGFALGPGEGEAHWLLGMLEVVKVCGADTGGEFGLLEVTVRAGVCSKHRRELSLRR